VVDQRNRRGLLPTLVLALGGFAVGTDALIVAGLLPSIAADLHTTISSTGLLVTAFAVGYAVGSPVLMTVLAGADRRALLTWSMLVFAAMNLVAAVTGSLAVLIVARVAAALTAGAYMPAAAAAAAMVVPPGMRGRALAVVLGGASLATATGVPIGLLVAGWGSWRTGFVFVAGLGLVAAIGVRLFLPIVPAVPRVTLRERLSVLADRQVLFILGITVIAMTGGFSIYTYLAPIFTPLGASAVPLLVLVFGAGSLLGTWLSGYAVDRVGPAPVAITALGVLAVNFLTLPMVTRTLTGALLFMLVWGAAGWGFLPAQQHRLIALAPRAPAIAISLNASAMYLGIALGALVGAQVIGTAGPGVLWVVAAVCAAGSVAMVTVSARTGQPAGVAPAGQLS
jgi:predicted MFS family arabinose efflux permease